MFREITGGDGASLLPRRARFYRFEKALKGYIDDANLQINVSEQPQTEKIERNQNKAIFQKLFNYYQQKQRGEIAPKENLDKTTFRQEFTHLQETYRTMMDVKNILNNAYEELKK